MAGIHNRQAIDMHQVQAEIVENIKSGPYMLMKLRAPGIAANARPGQFVMLQAGPSPDPLLRRPFSLHDVWFEKRKAKQPAGILLLYHVAGRGTGLISEMPAGESVSIVGPLGNGFSECNTKRALLVAGGIGIAPMRFLADRLNSAGCRVTLMLGARTKRLLYTRDFDSASEIILTTDDGSEGMKGPVTGALEASLDEDSKNVTVYAAGPMPMLRKVASLAKLYNTPCELTLEARMACGIGACYGCVVKAIGKDGEPAYLRVCKEGPVFDSKKLVSF
jgi:dihydroorotate dehydrogenase electron transfer subunit